MNDIVMLTYIIAATERKCVVALHSDPHVSHPRRGSFVLPAETNLDAPLPGRGLAGVVHRGAVHDPAPVIDNMHVTLRNRAMGCE